MQRTSSLRQIKKTKKREFSDRCTKLASNLAIGVWDPDSEGERSDKIHLADSLSVLLVANNQAAMKDIYDILQPATFTLHEQ